jgi:transposase
LPKSKIIEKNKKIKEKRTQKRNEQRLKQKKKEQMNQLPKLDRKEEIYEAYTNQVSFNIT